MHLHSLSHFLLFALKGDNCIWRIIVYMISTWSCHCMLNHLCNLHLVSDDAVGPHLQWPGLLLPLARISSACHIFCQWNILNTSLTCRHLNLSAALKFTTVVMVMFYNVNWSASVVCVDFVLTLVNLWKLRKWVLSKRPNISKQIKHKQNTSIKNTDSDSGKSKGNNILITA